MARYLFSKVNARTLIAADPLCEEFVAKLKMGEGVGFDVKMVRNIRFHRKFFSLLDLAFTMWEPTGEKTHRGEPISKDRERFREDITILAGHYEATYSVDGSVKLQAKSISFAKCDEVAFDRLYRSVLNVVWEKILREANYRSPEEVDNVVSQLLSYGG